MKGIEINENLFSMVFCGGCFDLFHKCQGKQSLTPNLIIKALEFFHLPLFVFMRENGTDINAKDQHYLTALHFAAENGHLSVVELLFNQKAHINAKKICWVFRFNYTPLHYAAMEGHLCFVEYLVNQKAEINAKNQEGKTPLRLSSENGKSNVVEFLKSIQE